jgi:nucleosome assembly protein 1-like 1
LEEINIDDLEDDEADEHEEKLELDYQLGEDFKEKIIPRAIDYFTGKAVDFDMMGDEEDDFEDIDDDDNDDDDAVCLVASFSLLSALLMNLSFCLSDLSDY